MDARSGDVWTPPHVTHPTFFELCEEFRNTPTTTVDNPSTSMDRVLPPPTINESNPQEETTVPPTPEENVNPPATPMDTPHAESIPETAK